MMSLWSLLGRKPSEKVQREVEESRLLQVIDDDENENELDNEDMQTFQNNGDNNQTAQHTSNENEDDDELTVINGTMNDDEDSVQMYDDDDNAQGVSIDRDHHHMSV
jgi:hypothetical protein